MAFVESTLTRPEKSTGLRDDNYIHIWKSQFTSREVGIEISEARIIALSRVPSEDSSQPASFFLWNAQAETFYQEMTVDAKGLI
jgi:hypothetical protein